MSVRSPGSSGAQVAREGDWETATRRSHLPVLRHCCWTTRGRDAVDPVWISAPWAVSLHCRRSGPCGSRQRLGRDGHRRKAASCPSRTSSDVFAKCAFEEWSLRVWGNAHIVEWGHRRRTQRWLHRIACRRRDDVDSSWRAGNRERDRIRSIDERVLSENQSSGPLLVSPLPLQSGHAAWGVTNAPWCRRRSASAREPVLRTTSVILQAMFRPREVRSPYRAVASRTPRVAKKSPRTIKAPASDRTAQLNMRSHYSPMPASLHVVAERWNRFDGLFELCPCSALCERAGRHRSRWRRAGCEIVDVTKSRIFEPSFSTKMSGEGTDLGLLRARTPRGSAPNRHNPFGAFAPHPPCPTLVLRVLSRSSISSDRIRRLFNSDLLGASTQSRNEIIA